LQIFGWDLLEQVEERGKLFCAHPPLRRLLQQDKARVMPSRLYRFIFLKSNSIYLKVESCFGGGGAKKFAESEAGEQSRNPLVNQKQSGVVERGYR